MRDNEKNKKRQMRTWLALALCFWLSGCCQTLPLPPTIPGLNLPSFELPGFNAKQPQPTPLVQKFSAYVAPEFYSAIPMRVALVSTGGNSDRYGAQRKLIDELASEIRSASLFEVVQPPPFDCHTNIDAVLTGRFDEREVAAIARNYHCDAVMFIRVNQFKGFAPLQASVTTAMVDANQSVVIFAADGNWDAADPDIRRAYEHFVLEKLAHVPKSSQKIYLQSPNQFFGFVANQITSVLQIGCGQ